MVLLVLLFECMALEAASTSRINETLKHSIKGRAETLPDDDNLLSDLCDAIERGLKPEHVQELVNLLHVRAFGVPRTEKRRCVITGWGAVSPLGDGHNMWHNLLAGKTGLGRITLFDTTTFPFKMAGEVRGFDPNKYLGKRAVRVLSRIGQFACSSYVMARDDAGLRDENLERSRVDVMLGSASPYYGDVQQDFINSPSGWREYEPTLDPLIILRLFAQSQANAVSLIAKANGYVATISTACESSITAVGMAAQRIKDGYADVVITGGGDCQLNLFLSRCLAVTDLYTKSLDPLAVCPYDVNSSRASPGEGYAVFILEELEHALERGAYIYCEVLRHAQNADNKNVLYSMDKTGKSWGSVLGGACAGELPGCVVTHAPGDPEIDGTESRALRIAFGSAVSEIPVTSIKGAVGSGMAAATAFQVATAAMILKKGIIPPTANLNQIDPMYRDMLIVKSKPLIKNVDSALVSGHGIAALNSALYLRRMNE